MARIMITSGPTRQFLDPVRYMTNASSGKMGQALATVALEFGHSVLVVSGPVQVTYPSGVDVIRVVTTDQMLEVCEGEFPSVQGVIGAAAPCDYRPDHVETEKIAKSGQPLILRLVETPDIMATLGSTKRDGQWLVGFALETDDDRFRAIVKMQKKSCDLMVVNGPEAMDSDGSSIEILHRNGSLVGAHQGPKIEIARHIFSAIHAKLL